MFRGVKAVKVGGISEIVDEGNWSGGRIYEGVVFDGNWVYEGCVGN